MRIPKSAARKPEAEAGHGEPGTEVQLEITRVTKWDFRLQLFRVRRVGTKSVLFLEKTGLKTRLLPLSWLTLKVSSVWTERPGAKIDKCSKCLKHKAHFFTAWSII